MTSTRRSSFSLIAVLATAASSRGCSLGDISNVDGRGHFQRGSTGKLCRNHSQIQLLWGGGLQPGGFGALALAIRGAAQLLVFVRQEGMRLAGIRLYRRSLFQVRQGLGESAVQKQHAPQKQVCTVMVRLSL